MVNIPVKFKRVIADAFDDMARGGRRLCESSGSEHSALPDLFDLVNSFIEKENDYGFNVDDNEEENVNCDKRYGLEEDLMSMLRLENDDYVKMNIHAEVEKACIELGGVGFSPTGFKRRLMARLRVRGLDAGLCKSKWDKKGHCPPGKYEYIDVIVEGKRYIVEVSLASEFEIARQTGHYTSLLQLFPTIFVGEMWKLKKIVRLMCNSIKLSMKTEDIPVPPWRRNAYMQAKWLGPYRRTINEVPENFNATNDTDLAAMRSSSFMAAPQVVSGYCRQEFGSKIGTRKVGYLTAAFANSSMLS